jgi:hypothetical protein
MFYHSFPRPKHGQDSIQKGLKILENFLKSGILLVPEIITYKHGEKEYYAAQSRFCITQIDISELKAHEKYFGGFHLEFTNHQAYSLGAIPVFYLPGAEPDRVEWSLKKLASGYLHQLNALQAVCQNIHGINTDNFLGALQGIGSLLYPTDKDYEGEHVDLYNFRQREWRVNAGICVDGKQLDRELTPQEKKVLMSIDSGFFEKKITYADGTRLSRIDVCTVMPDVIYKPKPEPGEEKKEPETKLKPVRELIERIIVPKEALEKARAIAGQNHFDPAYIVDFASAMELEALESEYELIKNQRRIQLIRSAQALAEGMYRLKA